MRVRIVVADEGEARFYDAVGVDAPLEPCGHLANPAAHQHDRDLASDRPGRVYDHAPPAGGRRGAVSHHAANGERRPREQEARRFASRIAEELALARRQDRFDRLVLIAGLPFFGVLRTALRASLRGTEVTEVRKDLVHQDEASVRTHLPGHVFRSL